MHDFNDCLLVSGLEDPGYCGEPFMWADNHMSQRIDRALSNSKLFDLFDPIKVTNLTRLCSDHCPILVQMSNKILIILKVALNS
ncbi:hypothetical protein AXF42_Ash000810 [Apostasia shenzhenica]|uniref:Endonuclease/exonuclease/phosphatase domain-containing protein n=1 Tax=Apostasia shenzhenica TaxID=1088818 RepID=A0A2I0AT52_9ASPA|nr:hypothetical protein AXF42_Ash000810 [Apostasia shenzhenica]